jgi:hypothetical protein
MNKCRIFRDFDTDNVIRVLNNLGNESSLYREAYAHTNDQEEALDIWAVANTYKFQEYTKDLNLGEKEPALSDVLKYINNLNTTETLSSQDITDLSNNLQTLNIQNADTLLGKLQRTFFTGQGLFQVSRSKLRESGLYTDPEINNLMTFPSFRANIKEFINRLRNSLRKGNSLPNLFTDNSSYKDFVVQDSTQTTGIGKFKNYLPEDVRDYILSNVRNYTTDADFKTRIQAMDNIDIKDYILDNPQAYNYAKDIVRNSKIVPVFSEMDGMIVPKLNNDLAPALLNTLRVGESKESFTNSVDVLRNIPLDDWYGNEAVESILKNLELQAAFNHIDLYGLANSYNSKSREEILGILDVVDDFLFKAEMNDVSNTDIYDISSDIADFFGQDITPSEMTIPISGTDKGRNLSMIDTGLGEIEMFQSGGYVKFRDNLYQKAAIYNSFADMLDDTYTSLQQDITILPDPILEEMRLKTDSGYNFTRLFNLNNENGIKGSLSQIVSRQMDPNFSINSNADFDSAKQLTLYKILLKMPENTIRNQDIMDFMSRKAILDIDIESLDYLTSDFISDFYTKQLQEKIMESPLFDAAYKYFDITNRGLTFTTTNPLIKNQVLTLLSEEGIFPTLQAYSAVSKDDSLAFLMPEQLDEALIDIQDRRDYVVNSPETLQKFTKPYTKVDTTTAIVKNAVEEFIKLNDGIYELTDARDGVGIYSLLNSVSDPSYYVMNTSKPMVNTEIKIETYESSNTDSSLTNKSKISEATTNKMLENRVC